MLNRLTIGKKLAAGVVALAISLAVLGFMALRVISNLGGSLDGAVNRTARKLELAGKTREAFQDLRNQAVRVQIAYSIQQLEKQAKNSDSTCSACHSPAPPEQVIRSLEAGGAVLRRHTSELRRLLDDETASKALDSIETGAAQWVRHGAEYVRLAGASQFDAAHAVLQDRMVPIFEKVEESARLLAKKESESLETANREASLQVSRSQWTVVFIGILSLSAAASVLWLVLSITGTLRRLTAGMSQGAQQVASAASQVSASSQSLAQGASEQAATLQQTSATSEQINSMARRNSRNSTQAAGLVAESHKQFARAATALQELEAAMSRINSSSGKIAQIIKMIEEIAFQTNILALNAAVEAARAGEAGLGFAVVADEVRNLAEKCAQAARDTAALIDESNENSRQGKEKVDRVASSIRAMSEQAASIKTLVDEVTCGSQEQTRGIEQVAEAISQLGVVTQKNAASAQQNAAAGQELNAQADTLSQLAGELRTLVDG